MRFSGTLLLMLALAAGLIFAAARLARTTPTEAAAERFAAHDSTAYTLPPAKLAKAVALDRTRIVLTVAASVWWLLQLWLLLGTGAVARMRDFATGLAKSRWLQCYAFLGCLLLTVALLNLPLGIYGHWVALRDDLSVQGWSSWLGDRGMLLGLEWGFGGLVAMLMFWIIRKAPTRWWFWFWIPAAACVVAGVFAAPYVLDPLFNKFEPLAKSDPALVQRLEQVAARGGISIPPRRMFLMKASAKSTELNAYVTGFGASKRVVVWDTTVAAATPDEIAMIFAHEMGHYALGHVALGTAMTCVALLPFFWLGYLGVGVLLRRYGAAWRIPSQQDWGALAVLVLVLSTLATIAQPFTNGVSRSIEHNADVYGQEAVHGIVADPQATGRRSFQELGEASLDDPTPHPWFEFWFDTHPPIRFRAAFAEAYDPWAAGEHPKYFAK
jgi:Zn-dependent protease with chaperone function